MSKLRKALDKAKEARGEQSSTQVQNEEKAAATAAATQEGAVNTQDKPLKPVYTDTKIVHCNPDFLHQNRVISVCTRDEADRLKILRTQILNQMSEEGKNVLLVTSPGPGEGKTLTAINLAISFSHQFNKTVLLVDANIRNPSIHKYLGLDEGLGLSDYLVNQASLADCLINPGMDRIVIFRAGTPRTNSAELLGSLRMQALLGEMKDRYPDRFIIFDSASVLTSADPLVFANFVDGILIVVEAEKTKKEDLMKVMEMMKNKPIIGTVYNKSLD
jgi:non-specific protein-tyrosine kinase